jgi:sugar O-acyltransferase (sialic acid O-acetyltransferase NeuD family)
MKEKVIIGAGGFAREIIADIGNNIKCFVDDSYWEDGLYKISELNPLEHSVIVAIGDPSKRKDIINKLPNKIEFWNHISKHAIILEPLKSFGKGSIICAGCILTTNIHIGDHVHINLNSTIGHDCVISDYVTISPGVNISGNVNIKDNVYIGTNVGIREKIQIHSNVTIGMNSAVIKDIDSSGVYVGIPAIKKPNL